MPKKKTKQQFIDEAIKVHDNFYDYSNVDYKGNHTKVEIICPEHGSFPQTPANHLAGVGCYQCSLDKKSKNNSKPISKFIKQAKEKHGDLYYYDRVRYTNSRTEVEIVCPIHGPFLQTPNAHLRGCGCPYCGGTKRSNEEKFKEKAREVHGDKYNYDYVKYVNN